MSSQTFHYCLDVRGAIMWPDKKLRRMVADENGDFLPPRETRAWLMDQLAQGRDVLPIGKACDGFDYKSGCPGHPVAVPGTTEDGR